VVNQWIKRRCSEIVHIRHAAAIVPLATNLVFVPNVHEINANRLMATPVVVSRQEALTNRWWSYERPSYRHLFGRIVRARPPSGA